MTRHTWQIQKSRSFLFTRHYCLMSLPTNPTIHLSFLPSFPPAPPPRVSDMQGIQCVYMSCCVQAGCCRHQEESHLLQSMQSEPDHRRRWEKFFWTKWVNTEACVHSFTALTLTIVPDKYQPNPDFNLNSKPSLIKQPFEVVICRDWMSLCSIQHDYK